ncbi:AP-4 complex subunit mu-1 [Acrasis kona]|uniref:AP-4 complex subunit mu-1 n=1 Tax=Acrasis kona TaxID=1008807 RepID=A0AAW2YHZ0_9EUKA
MTISQFFILSPRGDKIITRDYRNDIVRGTEDIFFRYVKNYNGDAPPAFNVEGVNFFLTLYFVITTRLNDSPCLLLELLTRLSTLCKDYTGVLSEESIRKNFVLIYEVLDEVVDFGFIQSTSTEGVKQYVFNDPVEVDSQSGFLGNLQQLSLMEKKTIGSSAARRPVQGGASKKNEIFVDILERINVVFSAQGNVLHSEIIGGIVMKSFLSGQPELRLGLNEDLIIGRRDSTHGTNLDSINFADFVNLQQFENGRTLSLFPPDGEFTVMNYRVHGKYDLPFRIYPYVDRQSPYKLEVVIKVRADIPSSSSGSNVVVRIPVPKTAQTVVCDFETPTLPSQSPTTAAHNQYEYKSGEKCVLWGIKKFQGGTEQIIKVRISLAQQASSDIEKHVGPISMKFEIPMHNVSGLNVRFLKIEEKSKDYSPARWVRYIAQANSYVCRVG